MHYYHISQLYLKKSMLRVRISPACYIWLLVQQEICCAISFVWRMLRLRQSALISSVCPQTQPCVAAAVSSPPARWAIANIYSRKILSRAMFTSKAVAVAGHWLCLPARRKENLQLVLLNCNVTPACVSTIKADTFSHSISSIMIKINQRHVTWLHSQSCG